MLYTPSSAGMRLPALQNIATRKSLWRNWAKLAIPPVLQPIENCLYWIEFTIDSFAGFPLQLKANLFRRLPTGGIR